LNSVFQRIFKNGSKTYYYSSFFFPNSIKEDVFKLYSFVRKADDYVDEIPQRKKEFYKFREKYSNALEGEKSGDIVIDSFIELMKRKKFDREWVEAFLNSMELDLYVNSYETLTALKKYLYGSAEVVGLMMAKILDLPDESHESAKLLGRSMQYMNFIRDIKEDLHLGRNYFPRKDFIEYNISDLEYENTINDREAFYNLINRQIARYFDWQIRAEAGFKYIPKRYLIPIKTASEMYKWTAKTILKDPFIVYMRKVKPSIPRIVSTIGYQTIFA
jgi:phytoene synthase